MIGWLLAGPYPWMLMLAGTLIAAAVVLVLVVYQIVAVLLSKVRRES